MRTLLIVLLLVALPLPLAAQAEQNAVVERIVAVVDEDAIWLSELQQLATAMNGGYAPRDGEPVLREALEVLIDRRLVEHAAAQRGIVVSDAQVDAAIESVRATSGLDDVEFREAVGEAGYGWTEYREAIRRQFAMMIFVRSRAVASSEIDQREIAAELRRNAIVEIRL